MPTRSFSASPAAAKILVCTVNYENSDETESYCRRLLSNTASMSIAVLIADNSKSASASLQDLPNELGRSRVMYCHIPSNPGYAGGARLALSRIVSEFGPMQADAVVLSNVDIEFDVEDLDALVARALKRDARAEWILAPKILESGRSFGGNPQRTHRSKRPLRGLAYVARRNYLAYLAHRRLHHLRRRWTRNKPADSDSAFAPIYQAHGCFLVFGAGFFRQGGSFPEAPLFGEEYAFAEMAHHLNVPIWYTPSFEVLHHGGLSTNRLSSRGAFERRRTAIDFYRQWEPQNSIGLMATWFS